MGNKRKEDKWPAAEHLRIMAFVRSIVRKEAALFYQGKQPTASEIVKFLERFARGLNVAKETIRLWLIGENRPSDSHVNWIRQKFPASPDWLVPDIDSSPMRRFLCALDIWGSQIDSPARRLDITSEVITVGSGLASLSRRWGSVPSRTDIGTFSLECDIPRLRCRVPRQIPLTVYQPTNPLTLMEFMFRCGPYLELSDEAFTEWAIDLASLTLLTAVYIEGTTFAERVQSGTICDYNALPFNILFRGYGKWPNLESVRGALEDFPEFNNLETNYADRLMRAREVLRTELQFIGCDLSIVEWLFLRIKDRDRMWQKSPDALCH